MARRKTSGEWTNLKEQRARFRSFAKAIEGGGSGSAGATVFQRARLGITDAYAKAAQFIRDRARSGASSGGAPKRLWTGPRPAIFAFTDFDASSDDKRKRSSMVGVRTGLSSRAKDPNLYIQWGRGSRRRRDNSIAAGGLSMSFGALFERGTQNRRIRPIRYFRRAIFATRSQVLRMLTDAYRRATSAISQ